MKCSWPSPAILSPFALIVSNPAQKNAAQKTTVSSQNPVAKWGLRHTGKSASKILPNLPYLSAIHYWPLFSSEGYYCRLQSFSGTNGDVDYNTGKCKDQREWQT